VVGFPLLGKHRHVASTEPESAAGAALISGEKEAAEERVPKMRRPEPTELAVQFNQERKRICHIGRL
jgi:hypothetical protein